MRSSITMHSEPTARLLWRIKTTTVLGRVGEAEDRLSAALLVNEVALLAAADELAAATRDAMTWTATNPCPDLALGSRVALLLSTCAEAAQMAQRAITEPGADSEAVFGRISQLLAVVDFTSQTLDAW